MPGSPLPRLPPSRVAPTGPSRSFNFCRAQPASALGRGIGPPGRPGRGGGRWKGGGADPAVASVLAANAEADAGLIAIDAQGVLGWGNSERVLRRSDLGQF